MTTLACATGPTITYNVGANNAPVTFNSFTAGTMTLGFAPNAFGPLPGQAAPSGYGPTLGPATAVNAAAFATVSAQFGGSLPGVLALN